MALNFPPNPEIGDEYVGDNGVTYIWDGVKWAGQVTQGSVTGGGAIIEVWNNTSTIISTATGVFNFVGAGVVVTSTNTTVVTVAIEAEPLSTATTATLGGVKIGTGISITGDGVISVREGLQYWTESKTVVDSSQTAIVSLLVAGTQTNIDAVIKPQGDGAVTNDSSGDKRGSYAIDWQRIRNNSTDVASGNYAIISGGSFNQASGTHSVVIGGNNNINDADYAVVIGGINANTRGIKGAVVTPGFATAGDTDLNGSLQAGLYIMGVTTIDSLQEVLSTDSTSGLTAATQIVLRDRMAMHFKGTVLARDVATSSTVGAWTFEGVVKRDIGSISTNFVGTPSVNNLTSSIHSIFLDLESTLGCFFVRVIPDGSHLGQIKWAAKIETLELSDLGV